MNVATFYRFVRIEEPDALAAHLRSVAARLDLRGTILLAGEGINATLTGSTEALNSFLADLRQDARFSGMPVRMSCGEADNPIFFRMKVRVRPELIAMHCDGVDPAERTGVHVDAAAWNALLDDPDVTVIDARNRYEIALGTFPGAVDPGTRSFREFPQFAAQLDPARQPRVAMFCTGGIRCEKASAYLLQRGFAQVYQLDGGILSYLDQCRDDPGAENRFAGECFVFDQRISVAPDLNQGHYASCHACRHALTEAETRSPQYALDVSCPYCVDVQTPRQRAALQERARQARLAASRGERHVGAVMADKATLNERKG